MDSFKYHHPALILGFHAHGLALARSLGRRGIPVAAIDCRKHKSFDATRFCNQFYFVPSLEDDSIVDYLVALGQNNPSKNVLFVTRDRSVPVIAGHQDILKEYYHLNIAPHKTLLKMQNKAALNDLLTANNIKYPKTFVLNNNNGSLDLVLSQLKLPCIIKPAFRSRGFGKAYQVDSVSEIQKILAQQLGLNEELLIQEWIPGSSAQIYFCFVYLDKFGAVKANFTGHKLRSFPNLTGIASSMKPCDNQYVQEASLKLFQHLGYQGFGSTEFKRDPRTGEYYFIEFTAGRTDYNLEVAVANGVDLPFIGYCDMLDLPLPGTSVNNTKKAVCWVDFQRDIKAILEERQRGRYGYFKMFWNMLQNLNPRNRFTLFAFDDPQPFLMYIWDRFCAIGRKVKS